MLLLAAFSRTASIPFGGVTVKRVPLSIQYTVCISGGCTDWLLLMKMSLGSPELTLYTALPRVPSKTPAKSQADWMNVFFSKSNDRQTNRDSFHYTIVEWVSVCLSVVTIGRCQKETCRGWSSCSKDARRNTAFIGGSIVVQRKLIGQYRLLSCQPSHLIKKMNYCAFMEKTVKTDRKVGKARGWDSVIKPIGWYIYGKKMYIERGKLMSQDSESYSLQNLIFLLEYPEVRSLAF